VGETIAPSTNATGQESPSTNVWATAATDSIVASTSPSANSESGLMLARRSRSEVKNAAE